MEAANKSAKHNAGYKEITLNITNNKPIVSSIQPDSIVSEIINVDRIIANSQNTPSIEQGISAHNYHTKVDSLKKNGFKLFDSLLNIELSQLNINIPYYLEYVNLKNDSIISNLHYSNDTIGKSGYKKYTLLLSQQGDEAYCLYLYKPKWHLIKEMKNMVLGSFLMTLLLIFSYYYLLRVIWRQKSIDEIKSDFVSNMTHELKTPISISYAAIDAILNFGIGDDAAKRDEYLSISKKQLMHLNSLVEQILTVSIEERKNIKLKPESISITETFHSIVKQFRLNTHKQVNFDIFVENADLRIKADKLHFTNILNNLVENAVKYSGDEAVVTLTAIKDGNKIKLSVSDNGIGIPKHALDKVFDKFYRIPTGNVHNVKGYGLGLFYVKNMVEKHKWNIKVKSKLGKGSTFEISI